MEILVRARHVDLDGRLLETTREKLAKVPRFAPDVSRLEVEYSEIPNPRVPDNQVCEVTVHLKRQVLKAHAAAREQVAALDAVVDKVRQRVSRLQEKRIGRSHPRRATPPVVADEAP